MVKNYEKNIKPNLGSISLHIAFHKVHQASMFSLFWNAQKSRQNIQGHGDWGNATSKSLQY